MQLCAVKKPGNIRHIQEKTLVAHQAGTAIAVAASNEALPIAKPLGAGADGQNTCMALTPNTPGAQRPIDGFCTPPCKHLPKTASQPPPHAGLLRDPASPCLCFSITSATKKGAIGRVLKSSPSTTPCPGGLAVSIRRVCWALPAERSSDHSRSRWPEQATLTKRIKEIAETRVGYDDRRIEVLLHRKDWLVNHKHVRRLHSEMDLQLRSKSPKRRVKTLGRLARRVG